VTSSARTIDQRLTAEIEGFRGRLGEPIYAEILRRAGHSADARTIPNAERQKQTIEKMQAAARGFERLRQLAEMAGEAPFFALAERFKIASATELPSLASLKQLVENLESLANQQVAKRAVLRREEIMGEISILRPRRSLISIPVVEAVYCESCASVSDSSGGCCGVCGNISVWPLAELVPQPPMGPHSGSVPARRFAPIMRIELARAA
jgi:hypothetical protein